MATKWLNFNKSLVAVALTSSLAACSDSDSNPPPIEQVTCSAPQVPNSSGTACVDSNVPNSAPVVTSASSISVSEDIDLGTEVYTATATDANNDVISWGMADKQGIFSIDPTSGVVKVSNKDNLIASNLTNYSIDIAASDGKDATTQTVSIQVSPSVDSSKPSIIPSSSQAVVYYKRNDDDYTGWILHAWNNDACNGYAQFDDPGGSNTGTEWTVGLTPNGTDNNFGVYWLVDTKEDASCINYIIHKGNDKDPNDNDQKVVFDTSRSAFAVSGVGVFDNYQDVTTEAPFQISDSAAHWIDSKTLVWNQQESDVRLVYSDTAELDSNFVASEQNTIALSATTLTQAQKDLVPHLADWQAYQLDAEDSKIKQVLKSQLAIAAFAAAADQVPEKASYVQAAKVLDDVYTSASNDADEAKLGIQYTDTNVTASVWAPTATNIKLNVFDSNKTAVASYDMNENSATGIWSYTGDKSALDNMYYQYEVNVYHPVSKNMETLMATDPYSVNTSTNGRYSQFVDLTDSATKPDGWDEHQTPTIAKVEDAVLLEAHIRDVSASDKTVTAANRGKYLAFTETNSDAMQYLNRLTQAGVTHFHMLPVNDIATIKEQGTFNIDDTVATACSIASSLSICDSESDSATIRSVLEGYDPSTLDAAKLVDEIRGYDSFNWGYDPHHFNVVEGSYASNPEGVARIVEFRQMIQAMHEMGLRVVLDVVYNHTSTSALYDNSVFDKLVPGYYHRYNEVSGNIERSTCCENTATEHKMMAKFTVDSLVHWAEHYGFDGFRFDVMGHMPKQVILDGRDAVSAIDADTYFYGEGWNFGEVANDRLFEQATQANLAGSKVGTFNDRPRDTIRAAKLSQSNVSLADVDHIRLGLAGTLQNYVLEDQNGNKVLAKNFSQSAYASTPADIINYVSKHDNETLWDALQFGIESGTNTENRVRIHNLSAAIPVLSQGIPFFQLGVDKMRSKSMHRNTYDFGDWYNFVDYTNTTNNWNVGLPTPTEYGYNFDGQQTDAGHGEGWKWPIIANLAADTDVAVSGADIDFSEAVFSEFLNIRATSPLFRLTSAQDVIDRVGFHNTGASQTPGLIVMSIDDGTGLTDLDDSNDAIVVVVNGTATQQSHSIKTASGFQLHSIQATGRDSVTQQASFSADAEQGTFVVPAYTVAVFVKPQSGAQGSGLSVDPERVISPYGDTHLYFSAFGDGEDVALSYNDRGLYTANTSISSGSYQFAVGDMAFSDVNLAFADVDVAANSLAITQGTNQSFAVTIAQSGTYQLNLDVTSDKPSLSITLVTASISCETPVSAGQAPFDIAGSGNLYVRGSHSGWAATDDYVMTYIGENKYQSVADFDGSFQFKLASDDGSWQTQLWAQNADGSIKTAELELGQTHDIAYGNAGTTNNAMSLTQGTYRFTLTLNEANPAPETKPAGNLVVEQCN